MKQTTYIKHFYFGNAVYHVSDGVGDEVVLRVNYKENSFLLESVSGEPNAAFRKEVREFAGDLLSRKHKTDFAAE
jgi:hypothetical protein